MTRQVTKSWTLTADGEPSDVFSHIGGDAQYAIIFDAGTGTVVMQKQEDGRSTWEDITDASHTEGVQRKLNAFPKGTKFRPSLSGSAGPNINVRLHSLNNAGYV